MEGRRYAVRVEVAYSGGRLPDDERGALLYATGLLEKFDIAGKALDVRLRVAG